MSIDRGDTLFSLSLVLAVILIAAPIGYQRYSNYLETQEWELTASQMEIISLSAKRYIKDHYNDLYAKFESEQNFTLDAEVLQQSGYLPIGYILKNNQGQNYKILISKNKNNIMMNTLIVTTGGRRISFKGLKYISKRIKGAGGYIYAEGIANGAEGEWSVDLKSLGFDVSPGHLVNYLSAISQNTIREDSDRLYRYHVTGRDDLNQMHTDIDMDKHDVNNVKNIDAYNGLFKGNVGGQRIIAHQALWSDGNIMAQGDIHSSGGWLVTDQSKGWINIDHQGGFYMDDDDWVKSYKGKGISTTGEIRANKITSEGRLTASEFIKIKGQVFGNQFCDEDGLLGSSDDSTLMICRRNRWQKAGGNLGIYNNNGHFVGQYYGINSSNETLWIIASGGNSISSKVVNKGKCSNSSSLIGLVEGNKVGENTNDGIDAFSRSTLTFPVPANSRFQIISSPGRQYGCSQGDFVIKTYQ